MRKKLVAGNWKMSGTKESVNKLVNELNNIESNDNCQVVIFPSFIHLQQVKNQLTNDIKIGAQDCATEFDTVAYTGEVSAAHLKDIGASYVLVGHSERRTLIKESNEFLISKTKAALKADLTPIFCVGELLEEYNQQKGKEVVNAQVQVLIDGIGLDNLGKVVIAYEPVWAIGTGLSATGEYAQDIHASLRSYIAGQNADLAEKISILYGGSVKANNAKELMDKPDIDGVLVGGASLIAEEFAGICKAA
jgi:triosephosphate isomerase